MTPSWISPKFAISGQILKKNLCKYCEKWENIRCIDIWYIGIIFCTVVIHIQNKDIRYDTNLNESKY